LKCDFAAARSRYEESLVLAREVGDKSLVAWALSFLAEIAIILKRLLCGKIKRKSTWKE